MNVNQPFELCFTNIYEIKQLIINKGNDLGLLKPVFIENNVNTLNFTCIEAGFLRLSAWVYINLFELGRVSIDFFIEKIGVYNPNVYQEIKFFKQNVHAIRTFLYHSLKLTSQSDKYTESLVNKWFEISCGNLFPTDDKQWKTSYTCLIEQTQFFFNEILNAMLCIEQDEFSKQIVDELNLRLVRNHCFNDYKEICDQVTADLGIEGIDTHSFCSAHFNIWNKELSFLAFSINFAEESRKRIERDLIKFIPLPISSKDIMDFFQIKPGNEIREILREATFIYNEKPCSKLELLLILKSNHKLVENV